MTIRYSKRFQRQFKVLRPGERERFRRRLELFRRDPYADQLSHHVLKGSYAGLHSINIGGDLRALYIEKGNELILFELIGTHSQLYGK